MDYFLCLALLTIRIILIIKCGDYFVDAAIWIAEISHIPHFIIGATIVSSTELKDKSNNVYEEDIDSVDNTISGADIIIVFIMANSGEDSGYVEQTPGDRITFDVWHNGNGLIQEVLTQKNTNQKGNSNN